MAKLYKNSLKKKLCEEVCIHGKSTLKTAQEYSIPIKTFEKWITAFNKNNHCFDEEPIPNTFRFISKNMNDEISDDITNEELKKLLMKKDIEIARLKKGYLVEGGGMEQKVFVTFSKKNMK